jgi:hypothetical protein
MSQIVDLDMMAAEQRAFLRRGAVVSSDRAAPRVSWQELVAATPQVIRQTLPMVPWNIHKLLLVRRVVCAIHGSAGPAFDPLV